MFGSHKSRASGGSDLVAFHIFTGILSLTFPSIANKKLKPSPANASSSLKKTTAGKAIS